MSAKSNKKTGRADAAFQLGLKLHQQGRIDGAREHYRQALQHQSRHFHALHLLGVIEAQKGDPARAIEYIGKAILVDPKSPAAHSNYGNALRQLNRNEEAVKSYDAAISIKADFADAHYNRGHALLALERYEAALASFDRTIASQPNHPDAHRYRGLARLSLRQYSAAVASFEAAIALKPDHADAYNKRGIALAALNQHLAAIQSYEQSLARNPKSAEAHFNRGVSLYALDQYAAAVACYDAAIALKPDYPEAYNNRGFALFRLKLDQDAIASFNHAIALRADYADAFNNRATVLAGSRQFDRAVADYDRAIALNPDFTDAYNNRAILHAAFAHHDQALADYDTAIALTPELADAHYNRGILLNALARYEAAVRSFEEALRLQPDIKFAYGLRLHAKTQMCEWAGASEEIAGLREKIARGEAASPPFAMLGLHDSAALHRTAAEIWVRETCAPPSPPARLPQYPRRQRIRIGYFSADFHEHATSHLMAGLFEAHDRSLFELCAYSFGQDWVDAMRGRLRDAFDGFIDVRAKSDREITLLAQEREIDIAIDLKGFTQDSRPNIFAGRAAPLQVNYLGFPGSMGASYIDYLIADSTLIPEGTQSAYLEKIIYLPDTYQPNDMKRQYPSLLRTREELGLPPDAFVFCCFNNNYKILPATFDCWMRILARVEGSVLWLLEGNARAASNLRQEAQRRGINAERLIFAKRAAAQEHLARHQAADLFLDTWPCNAHTTASDALWMGTPVLTCIGEGFAGRVAASLLKAIDLPELIAPNPVEYEELAVTIAGDRQRLAGITQRLAAKRLSAPLFDTKLYTQHLEAAYLKIYERHLTGLPPDHIHI